MSGIVRIHGDIRYENDKIRIENVSQVEIQNKQDPNRLSEHWVFCDY